MALLENHLEQISLSAAAIAELPFPPPKRFTNALLRFHDITALIRDTEAHERALFSVAPSGSQRRSTAYGSKIDRDKFASGNAFLRQRRQYSAVATILGGELGEQLRNEGMRSGTDRGEVDVELLLQGAEKLSGVYPIPGAKEKISSLQSRFNQLTASITRYKTRVSKHTTQLSQLNRRTNSSTDDDYLDPGAPPDVGAGDGKLGEMPITVEQLEREEQEIRDLERKKQTLEDRVSGMERDLGGLLR